MHIHTYIYIYTHTETYEQDHGGTLELQNDIKPLLIKHNVDFYFCGHDHSLQHLQWDDVDYVVSGGGSRECIILYCTCYDDHLHCGDVDYFYVVSGEGPREFPSPDFE